MPTIASAACGRHAGNQCRVWQTRGQSVPRVADTLAISAACGRHAGNQCRVWQYTLATVPHVASRGYQCRAWLALCADPETQDLSPLDVSVGGRTPGRRSLGFKIPQTCQGLSGHLFSLSDYQVVCQGVFSRVPFTSAHSHVSHNSIHLLLLRF